LLERIVALALWRAIPSAEQALPTYLFGPPEGGYHENCHHDDLSAPSRRPVTVCGTI
jgi:hypothetical protein